MVENCSDLEGFLLFHSLGGGTGSGLGSLILENLVMEYGEQTRINFSIYPGSKNAVSVVEPYNTILSMRSLIGSSDAVVVLDNEAVYEICQNHLNIRRPTFTNLNRLISQVISSMTASMRFNGDLNASLNEFKTNLVPTQNLHFMFPSYAPIIPKENNENSSDITNEVFGQANSIAKCDPRQGRCLAGTLMYRGDIVQEEVISSFADLRATHTFRINDWCPDEVKWGINAQKALAFSNDDIWRVAKSACMISNSTAIAGVFARLNCKFELLYAKRAYIHWFVVEGMESDEFAEACESMAQIEQEYINAGVEA
ncbi:unnamed protein product [Blepharisma stoltei]|uniref:Tubulin alpha chain n=1 Tax=Blepharisma stoltei TaxID=1481888 RepID=A0AAU9IJ70_9CILI|nr:unnamed protein product [Blepharisma stoltei]